MKLESLDELRTAFVEWRSRKRHAREAVPEDLLERARRSIRVHGLGRVSTATKVERSRLVGARSGRGQISRRGRPQRTRMPSFSRLELVAPSAAHSPMVEVETPAGVKVRIFTQTDQMLGLLSLLCGIGGGR